MPQVDLDNFVCGINICGDSRVACEPASDPELTNPDPDFPAESYLIRIGDDSDLWDDVSHVYDRDRDGSTRGTTNPKSNPGHSSSSSKRYSGNLKATTKAPIIALPNKIKMHHHHQGQCMRKPRSSNREFIPKNKATVLLVPGSPEVSCFGKVLSQREHREQCGKKLPRKTSKISWFRAVFGCFGGGKAAAVDREEEESRENIPVRERKVSMEEERVPGLGGMKRFVSGRRPASWGGDAEVDLDSEDGHMPWSGRWTGGD